MLKLGDTMVSSLIMEIFYSNYEISMAAFKTLVHEASKPLQYMVPLLFYAAVVTRYNMYLL